MNVEEIYSKLSGHMLEGIMLHEQLMNCFLFLGLDGFAKEHEYHYLEETQNHIKLMRYYSDHHRGIIQMGSIDASSIIPASWYSNKKDNVDPGTRLKAIQAAYDEWIRWEKDTKTLYEHSYAELVALKEIASAEFVSELVKDVDYELSEAMNDKIQNELVSYDFPYLADLQPVKEKTFSKKIKRLFSRIDK